MCGIAGILNTQTGFVESSSIQALADALKHRGPDGEGIFLKDGLALAHRRLSIIDLSSAASQPFISSDGRYVLVFNGEIYNYLSLRREYFSDIVFASDSDTEVLLCMLIRFQADALPKLRGMFAFAFYDTQEETLLLACDPFGKKPLYYVWNAGTFIFASEPKALVASGLIEPHLEASAVELYFQHEYVPTPNTIFEGVRLLPGGHVLTISPRKQSISQWKPILPVSRSHISFSTATKTLDNLLGQAVERRMVADVPVGLFLSGGLDSSTIGWYMRTIRPNADIHSCSVSFQERSFNEGPIAQRVAQRLGMVHHSVEFSHDLFLKTLQEIIPFIDTPFADASLLPTYAVSKLAREHMTVVLDGDGSDELLGGYGTFDAYEMAYRLRHIPKSVWRVAYSIASRLPVSDSYFSFEFKLKSFLRGASYPAPENLDVWLGAFTSEELTLLLSNARRHTSPSVASIPSHDPFMQASLFHIQGYLANDILVKLDRATMMRGLEARTPFLDVDLVEFLLGLPSSYKRHKRILRHLMEHRLPSEVVRRKKQGFGIPLTSWLARPDSVARTVLSENRLKSVGLFTIPYIYRLMDEHERGVYDHRKKLWTLIMFQLWHEYWIQGTAPSIYE